MVKCPKCGKDIDDLIVREINCGSLSINDTGEPEFEWAEEVCAGVEPDLEFVCPECKQILFDDRGEAADFLKSGV